MLPKAAAGLAEAGDMTCLLRCTKDLVLNSPGNAALHSPLPSLTFFIDYLLPQRTLCRLVGLEVSIGSFEGGDHEGDNDSVPNPHPTPDPGDLKDHRSFRSHVAC